MAALLSWNEIKARANNFSREWQAEGRERAESQSFWNDFFKVFGITRRRPTRTLCLDGFFRTAAAASALCSMALLSFPV